MAEISVTFLHPINAAEKPATLPDSITADRMINELIAIGFVTEPKPNEKYSLKIKETDILISGVETLADGGAKDGCLIRVIIPIS